MKNNRCLSFGRQGFTFIEVMVIMGMMAILVGFATINLIGAQRKASLTQTVDTLTADLRGQQTKAMTGQIKNGSVPAGYGIYFETNRYVLFSGSSYNAGDSSNASVPLTPPITVSAVTFPNSRILFATKSGELNGFISGSNTVTLKEGTSGQTKTIHLNQYGVVNLIN